MRTARRTVLALALFALAAAAGLHVAARSDAVLAWALGRIAAASGGRLAFEGVRGAIVGAPAIGRIRYEDPDLAVEARAVSFDWSPLALVFGRVDVASLTAAAVTVTVKPSAAPATLPSDIGLPLPVRIGRAEVARLAIASGASTVALDDVRAAYRGDAAAHRLDEVSGRAFGATLRDGRYAIAAKPPFAISGAAAAERPGPPFPVVLEATFGGTLAAMDFALAARSGAWERADGALRVTPFGPAWLAEARIAVAAVDLGKLDPSWPATRLAVTIDGAGAANGDIAGSLAATNAEPGPLDKARLPVAAANARYVLAAGGKARLEALALTFAGNGTATGAAAIDGSGARVALTVRALDLRGLHSQLRTSALGGKIDADLAAEVQSVRASLSEPGLAFAFDAVRRGDAVEFREARAAARGGEVRGSGAVALGGRRPFAAKLAFSRFDPSAFGDYPAASLSGEAAVAGEAASPWRADADVRLGPSRFRGTPVAGGGTLSASPDRIARADVALTLGANRATVRGALGRAGDALAIDWDAPKLAELDRAIAGRASGSLVLTGPLAAPAAKFSVRGESLALPGGATIARLAARGEVSPRPEAPLVVEIDTGRVAARGLQAERVAANAEGTLARHRLRAAASGTDFAVRAEAAGGWDARRGWSGRIESFTNEGAYPAALAAPASLEVAPGRARLGPLEARIADGAFRLREARWEEGRIASEGSFRALPAAVLARLLGANVDGDLTLAGEWSITAAPRLDGTLAVRREAGDAVLPTAPPFPLGLSEARLDARFVADRLAATLAISGAGLGEIRARATLAPAGEAGLTRDAALDASVDAGLASLKVLARLFPQEVIADGVVRATLRAAGTLASPVVTGTFAGDGLRIEAPPHGIDWRDGRVRAALTASSLELTELSVRGGEGSFRASGRIPRVGNDGARIEWRADRFLALARPDRRLVASGAGTASYAGQRVRLAGELRADEGNFEFGRSGLPELGDDVLIVGAPRERRQTLADLPLDLDLALDFGERLRVAGYGLEAMLGGKLRVEAPRGEPLGRGTVYVRKGTYRAYGQNLAIERGQLVFDGPLANPALRVEAWRRNQQVAAGVEVTGTVRAPRVRIVSEPPVPEGEALSWLVLGRPPDTSNKADLAALQVAAAALFYGDENAPVTRQVARALGLDDITIGTGTGAGAGAGPGGALQGQVIAFGKRLSDRIYLTYEQAIAATGSVVKLDYLLTQRISLRAEAGTRTGGGIHYRYTFD
ncbi:MAG: translocation/assembly module TamB domain-containing protein [Burkholderiales bacterium]|nr:translocation/assembly module TamB domain-containing protein [Burkholderiales bacterium]